MKYFLSFILFFLFVNTLFAQNNSLSLSSPDNKLEFNFEIKNSDRLQQAMFYSIQYNEKDVVKLSQLGIIHKGRNGWNTPHWSENIELIDSDKSSKDTSWKPVYGERSTVRDYYNEMAIRVRMKGKTNRELLIYVRAYNEGIAFKYHYPEGKSAQIIDIESELTSFSFETGTEAYFSAKAQGEYELLPLSDWENESERPLTLVLPNGLFACVAEAEMVNYSRMRLELAEGKPNTLKVNLFGGVTEAPPFSTPWRVVMVAEKPGDLIENNDIILNLNPPSKIENSAWIKPGKVIREVTLSDAGAKACVDFAVERNLQYIHFDAGWYGHEYYVAEDATTITVDSLRNPKRDLDLHKAIKYAKSKGIGVLVYVNHRALERQLDEILPLYKNWGIDGIKYGFVQAGSHRWTTWLHEAVRKAADHQLMIDIHDVYRPTGFSRTYPNLMTQEGIRGNEEMPDATHNTILPFTRYIAGAGDYTVCYYYREEFGHPKRHIMTTPAHQLALSVVCYSPLQWIYWYDKPADYQGEPEIEFFDHVPTVWDDTKVISGEIGQYIAMARKSGKDWFVGVITNNDGRSLEISLDFLEEGKKYKAFLYEDGGEKIKIRTHVKIEEKKVKQGDKIKMELRPSGGMAISIVEMD
ncbi:MAG: glycoside hydrolase family 97 protein [Flammeovirgaceae bacterium]|nr:glycoside hydrolase family 97 protein [Flammeovirgaceae bacterium]